MQNHRFPLGWKYWLTWYDIQLYKKFQHDQRCVLHQYAKTHSAHRPWKAWHQIHRKQNLLDLPGLDTPIQEELSSLESIRYASQQFAWQCSVSWLDPSSPTWSYGHCTMQRSSQHPISDCWMWNFPLDKVSASFWWKCWTEQISVHYVWESKRRSQCIWIWHHWEYVKITMWCFLR